MLLFHTRFAEKLAGLQYESHGKLTKTAFDGGDESYTHYHVYANRTIGKVSPYVLVDSLRAGKFPKGTHMFIHDGKKEVASHTMEGNPDPHFYAHTQKMLSKISLEEGVSAKKAKEGGYWPRDHTWEIALPKTHFKSEEAVNKHLIRHGTEKRLYK